MKYPSPKKLELYNKLRKLIHNACVITHNNLIHVVETPKPNQKESINCRYNSKTPFYPTLEQT